MRSPGSRLLRTVGIAFLALACEQPPAPLDPAAPAVEWPAYGGSERGDRFSPLADVRRENVEALEVAWIHHGGDASDGSDGTTRTSFNATPLVVDETLYYCTGANRVFALDPETGEQRWVFDPGLRHVRIQPPNPYPRVCRGVAYWKDAAAPEGAECGRRIFTGTIDAELIALDAESGRPCRDFGSDGRVALREDVGVRTPFEYYTTSPPLVVQDRVVVGALVSDSLAADAPSGVVRAFDARTGALRWAWDPVPPGFVPDPGRRYALGTPNVWSILSADSERGLVFVPTGNASPDYFGGLRNGMDHYASSVVALSAESGQVVWSFQTVHHDLWDYDVASQPLLFDFVRAGTSGPALLQATKMGHLFLLDRETGRPLFPVEERAVPQNGGVPGENLSPTQPFPTHPPPLHPASLRPEDAWGFTFWDRDRCRDKIAALRSDGIFTPPSLQGSVHFPGPGGGPNWGSVALDPERSIAYVNQSRLPIVVQLIPRDDYEVLDPGRFAYPNELYPMEGTPYAVRRSPLLSPFGALCNPPPWGTLVAVDLVAGGILWEATLGTTRDQAPFPFWFPLGSPNLGGPLLTAGHLVFIGATTDRFLRAFDAETGKELWAYRLPFTANATPMTYRARPGGRQFVVVAAGGHQWSEPGDALIAFALPGAEAR